MVWYKHNLKHQITCTIAYSTKTLISRHKYPRVPLEYTLSAPKFPKVPPKYGLFHTCTFVLWICTGLDVYDHKLNRHISSIILTNKYFGLMNCIGHVHVVVLLYLKCELLYITYNFCTFIHTV